MIEETKTREKRKKKHKTEAIGIRINRIERKILEEQAEKQEMSISEYIRLLIHKEKEKDKNE